MARSTGRPHRRAAGVTAPPQCGRSLLLPLHLIAAAVDMEPVPGAVEVFDVWERPVCRLQDGHDDIHRGHVLDLDGPHSGSVWASWVDAGVPFLVVLPDCPGATLDGIDGCELYEHHPGLHSFGLHDPDAERVQALLDLKRAVLPHPYDD